MRGVGAVNGMPDPGLQPERTALAWRRTGLAVVVGSVLAARLLGEAVGVAAVALGVAGVGVGMLLLLSAGRRARRTGTSLRDNGDLSAGPGAAPLAVVAATGALAGVVALAFVLF